MTRKEFLSFISATAIAACLQGCSPAKTATNTKQVKLAISGMH